MCLLGVAAGRVRVELVEETSRPCLHTAITLYAGILDEIERADYDVFSRRVAVGVPRRAAEALRGVQSARAVQRRGRGTPTSTA